MRSDHWFFELFQALPDLVRRLIPDPAAADAASDPIGGEAEEEESLYVFQAEALKKVIHNLDGVLWPRHHPRGTAKQPVVILEVQMHPDRRFHRRLAAETFRFLQQHEAVAHLRVVVLVAHPRLALGSDHPRLLERFLQRDVTWVDLEALAQRDDLDPLLSLLTLPVRGEPDLAPCCQRILRLRPDLIELILPILSERFTGLSLPQIMASLGISIDTWRHTRAFQEILQEGREEGRQEGRQEGKQEGKQEGRREGLEEGLQVGRRREACALALRQLERRCGPLSSPSRARVEALGLPQLEELALALLDFGGPDDLRDWLGTIES